MDGDAIGHKIYERGGERAIIPSERCHQSGVHASIARGTFPSTSRANPDFGIVSSTRGLGEACRGVVRHRFDRHNATQTSADVLWRGIAAGLTNTR